MQLHAFDIMAVDIGSMNENIFNKNSEWGEFGRSILRYFLYALIYACSICGVGYSIGAMIIYILNYEFATIIYINPGWHFFMASFSGILCAKGIGKFYLLKNIKNLFSENTSKVFKNGWIVIFHGFFIILSIYMCFLVVNSYLFWYN